MKTFQLPAVMAALWASLLTPSVAAQTRFSALYQFDTSAGGEVPNGVVGASGVLYGTTYFGGALGQGIVFSLQPPSSPGGTWTETPLHSFTGQDGDGGFPNAAPVVGADGSLYGSTVYGGASHGCGSDPFGCGTVFRLRPPAQSPPGAGGTWTEELLYNFTGGSDGNGPFAAPVLGPTGAIYGTTAGGGAYGRGMVFELRPPATPGGAWTETVLYSFTGGSDGNGPVGLTMSGQGVLYGVAQIGGSASAGTLFELTPPAAPGAAWSETTIYTFQGGADGSVPYQPPVVAPDGTLYGTTSSSQMYWGNGAFGVGTVFELKPPATPGGAWTETVLQRFSSNGVWGPDSPLILRDEALYGTASSEEGGTLFTLRKATPDGPWSRTVLHAFGGENVPGGRLVMDANGAIFGVTTPVSLLTPGGSAYRLAP